MNITITIDDLGMGGAQHVVYELVKHIDKSKFKVTIICTDGIVDSFLEKQMLAEQENGDFSIVFLKKNLLSYINTPFKYLNKIVKRILRIPSELLIINSLSKAVKLSKPDIVHAHQRGILAGFYTIKKNIPLIATVHTDPSATFYRTCEKIILKRLIKHNKITIIGISEYNLKLIKNYWKLNDNIIDYVNNGININNFYNKEHDVFTFINSSRQDINKNQSLILRAFSRLLKVDTCPLKLLLVGGGNTHNLLMEEADRLGIRENVEFTGYVKSPIEYLAVSDVYISSANREGLSLSVLEAMASGLPVIATDAGGVRDLAKENGILININDEDACYDAMKKIKNDSSLYNFMSKKSLEMVKDYSASSMAQKYSNLYEKIYNNNN